MLTRLFTSTFQSYTYEDTLFSRLYVISDANTDDNYGSNNSANLVQLLNRCVENSRRNK